MSIDPGKIISGLNKLKRKFEDFFNGFGDTVVGIGKEIEGLGAGLNLGFKDIGFLLRNCFLLNQ